MTAAQIGPAPGPRWELPLAAALSLAALLVLRRAGLDDPYWWDAAAVYVPGSKWVAENHFAAFPGVFPSDLARGHTTLFYVITAIPFAIFGPGPIVGHSVVLAFSVLGLVCTYALGARLFGRPAGVVAALLLVVSPLYLTMSSQVLPEVPLAALTAASLLAFAHGRHGAAAFLGLLIVLTKETGVACPLAITGALVLQAWRARALAPYVRPLALSLIPTVALALFFIWQRVAEGWWVLPLHAELFAQEHSYLSQGAGVFSTMLVADGRVVVLVAALGLGILRARRAPETFAPYAGEPPRWVVLAALSLVFLANQGFFTQMWFLERYALAAHPGLACLLAGALIPAVPPRDARVEWAAGALAVLATVGIALGSQYAGTGYASGETTFRYLRMIEAHRRVYATLEETTPRPLVMTAWPMTEELKKPYLGWVREPFDVLSIRGYLDGSAHLPEGREVDAIITSPELGHHAALRREARRRGLRQTQREDVEGAIVELWTRPSPPVQ